MAQHLVDTPSLVEVIGLQQLPHFTTLHKVAERLLVSANAKRLLERSIRVHLGRRRLVACGAVDSTGLECTAASGYFVRRRSRVSEPWKKVVYHRFPKLGVICDTQDHFILAGRGPRPYVDDFRPILAEALRNVRFANFVADAGYDSEGNHRYARASHGIRTMIPPMHGRPTKKPATGHHRRLMQVRFSRPLYRNRTQVETVISMIKRRQGSHVHGRKYQSQCRDLRLMALTHNAMILLYLQVFYRAISDLFIPGSEYRLAKRSKLVCAVRKSSTAEFSLGRNDLRNIPSSRPRHLGRSRFQVGSRDRPNI